MADMNVELRFKHLLLEPNLYNYRDNLHRYLNIIAPRQLDYYDERILFIKMAASNATFAQEITAILLEFGQDINESNKFGKTALHVALEHVCCNPKMVQLLLENGADPNAGNITSSTPLHYAVQNANCSVDVIKLLLNKGANIDAVNDLGDTPLLRALRNSKTSIDIISYLLKNGADITKRNNYGRTALHSAVANFDCSPEIIKLLLDEGAPVNVLNHSGKSPLFRAVESFCEPEVVRLLLDRGADIFHGVSVFEKAVNNFNNVCHCYKNCEGICNERSILLLLLLMKFAFLLDLNFDVDLFINSMSDYQQLSEVVSLFHKEALAMDSTLIAEKTTLREYISGRKQVRLYPSDEAGGELCSIHTLLHFFESNKFPLYGDIFIAKLRMNVLRNSLYLYVFDSKGQRKDVDYHATAIAFMHLDDVDVLNVALSQHSAELCEFCS